MLETSARLLKLLSLLQTTREWSGTELAERLEVTTRTVRNDVERLRDLGYPVHATRGAAGGYRLGAGAALPPLLLDDDEAVAVTVGLRSGASGSVTGIEEASLRALAKLEQVLPSRLRHRLAALNTYTSAVPPMGRVGPQVSTEVLTAIVAACRDRERLRFDYTAHGGEPSRRDVEPYQVVNWGRRWYLVAWDVGRADWRTYRVDRIEPKVPTGPRFTPRPLPAEDLPTYVAQHVGTVTWRYRARVTVFAPAEQVASRLPIQMVPVEPIDDATCSVQLGSDNLESLAVWLGVLGSDFRIEDAPELAAHLRVIADRYRRAAG
jgi:predicted DNA-binding transcriptional regulator YafY